VWKKDVVCILCRECIALVKELGCPVEHIVLPTFAVEHKLFVGPFARKFPSAKVHVAPRQEHNCLTVEAFEQAG
jgi:hypothetical protein